MAISLYTSQSTASLVSGSGAGVSYARQVLAQILDCAPEQVPIRRGSGGKPELDHPGYDFSVAHCRDWIMLAVSTTGPVGVDLEDPQRERNWQALSRRFLHRAEQQLVAASPAPSVAFCEIWTAKEAVVKASGLGLRTRLSALDVTVEPVRFGGAWWLQRPSAPDGLVACVASTSPDSPLAQHNGPIP